MMVVGGQVDAGTWGIQVGGGTKGVLYVTTYGAGWAEEVRIGSSLAWPLDGAVGTSYTFKKLDTAVPEDRAAYACNLIGAHTVYRFTFDSTPGTTVSCT